MSSLVATADDTVDALIKRAKRKSGSVPIRRAFVQQGQRPHLEPGPLAPFVQHHDPNGLLLYLLFLAAATAAPWQIRWPNAVWARALGLDPNSGPTTVSRHLRRLEDRQLISRVRVKRQALITLRAEDGSGLLYSHPGATKDRYFKLPLTFWQGPDRLYRTLSLPETATLLIALSLPDGFILPAEHAPSWYGLSADTVQAGLYGLQKRGILTGRSEEYKAPLTAKGIATHRRYTLRPPFGPHGRRSKTTDGGPAPEPTGGATASS